MFSLTLVCEPIIDVRAKDLTGNIYVISDRPFSPADSGYTTKRNALIRPPLISKTRPLYHEVLLGFRNMRLEKCIRLKQSIGSSKLLATLHVAIQNATRLDGAEQKASQGLKRINRTP